MKRKNLKIAAALSGALTVIITCIMDFVLFPRIEATTQGIKSFDLNPFGMSFETAEKYLELIGEEGRKIYLNVQLPLDFVYPLVYTFFFISMFVLLSKSAKVKIFFPIFLFLADYLENILTVVMLKSESLSPRLAFFASCATSAKSVLMYITIIILAVDIVLYIVRKRKTSH